MTMHVMGTPLVRFMARVDLAAPDGCWQWRGAMSDDGYGRFSVNPSYRARAHRFAYEHMRGPIPSGLTLDHLCRNRGCVNPWHLEAVTNRVNILRGTGMAARHIVKTHCHRGHEFTPENTRLTGPDRRWRDCLACARERRLRHQQEVAA